MLPDQINNLYNIQFFVTVIMWLSLVIALFRRHQKTSRRVVVVIAWLVGSAILCPISTAQLNGIYDKLIYAGIQRALDEQCGQGYTPAEAGTYVRMSSYHWRWNGQRSNRFVMCDYEPGYVSWICVC